MEEQFSLEELVKFGQYVLSDERTGWIKNNHAEEDLDKRIEHYKNKLKYVKEKVA